jgi:hypothetical protein
MKQIKNELGKKREKKLNIWDLKSHLDFDII